MRQGRTNFSRKDTSQVGSYGILAFLQMITHLGKKLNCSQVFQYIVLSIAFSHDVLEFSFSWHARQAVKSRQLFLHTSEESCLVVLITFCASLLANLESANQESWVPCGGILCRHRGWICTRCSTHSTWTETGYPNRPQTCGISSAWAFGRCFKLGPELSA